MKKLLSVLSILLLSACGTTDKLSTALLNSGIPAGESRIIVSRKSDMLYVGAAAHVSVNGEQFASLGSGGQAMTDVKAGHLTVSVDGTGSFRSYKSEIDAKAGKTYSFLVSPNPTVGTFLGGTLGDAMTSSPEENAGFFKIERTK